MWDPELAVISGSRQAAIRMVRGKPATGYPWPQTLQETRSRCGSLNDT